MSNSSPFGLSIFDTTTKANEGQWLEFENPATGKPSGVAIKMHGPDSSIFKEAEEDFARRRSEWIQTADSVEKLRLQQEARIFILVAVSIEWRGVPGADGQPVPFNKSNVKLFFENYPECVRQADAFLNVKRNWLADIEGNSQPGVNGASA